MDNNITHYDTKIKRILEGLLQVNYKTKNDYLNSFILYLSSNEETACYNCIFSEWIVHATNLWQNQLPTKQILCFAIHLCGLLSKNEQTFNLFNNENIYERLLRLARPDDAKTCPVTKLSVIKLLDAILHHESGLKWIINSKSWLIVIGLSLTNQTIYITCDGNKFLAKLLDLTSTINESFCRQVVETIMERLNETTFNTIKCTLSNLLEISDEEIYKTISPTLSLVCNILEIFLENTSKAKNFRVVTLFIDDFKLEQCVNNFLLLAQNKDFIFDLYKIQMIVVHFSCVITVNCNSAANKFYQIFSTNVAKNFPENILKLCYINFVYWQHSKHCIYPPKNIEKMNDTNEPLFENQVMIMQLLPLFIISTKLFSLKRLENDEYRDNYIDKIVKLCSVPTIRLAYLWKDILSTAPNAFEISTLALQYIIRSKHLYERHVGVSIFQSLVYCLNDLTVFLMENPTKSDIIVKESSYVSLLVDTVGMFIEEFQITWRDSIETIGVLKISIDILSLPTWPPKLVVKALKCVDIAIAKYMSPNMILLIDKMNEDYSMPYLGPLLYAKLHDINWEVRDSALEVLCTIGHNAKTKFPSFQKVVLDSQLLSLVVKIALNDEEFFVRATALKCLQQMIQVDDFWTDILKKHDLNALVMEILHKETEGIVRKEAASLIATIYEHNHFPATLLPKIYDIMTHASVADLHWEVKVEALNFWQIVINDLLQEQGMIDGSFPTFVFSKEQRKIISLTENEVQKRLIKVLQRLSEIGCLSVLISSIQDDCDLEVAKRATQITRKFIDLLNNYKICYGSSLCISSPPTSPLIRDDDGTPCLFNTKMSCESPPNNDNKMNVVLNDILNAQDENLLTKMCCPVENRQQNFIEIQCKRVMEPNEFLKFTQQDFECVVNEKEKWLVNMDQLGSILDDILKEYDESDVNSMDCY